MCEKTLRCALAPVAGAAAAAADLPPRLPSFCRQSLAATCTRLRFASLLWFPTVKLSRLPEDPEEAALVAAWLCERRGEPVPPGCLCCSGSWQPWLPFCSEMEAALILSCSPTSPAPHAPATTCRRLLCCAARAAIEVHAGREEEGQLALIDGLVALRSAPVVSLQIFAADADLPSDFLAGYECLVDLYWEGGAWRAAGGPSRTSPSCSA